MSNLILMSDSYKYSQWVQYPPETRFVYSYIESRGGDYDETVFFGLQAFIQEYLTKPITKADIDEAEALILEHGEPFNREGWEYILNVHSGYFPVRILAVPEGSVIPTSNVLATIENTDPNCFWLTSFLETALLRAIWYPSTVATRSRSIKQTIKKYIDKSGDDDVAWKLQDFGARGSTSHESAAIGGAAHLVNFLGTDTVEALVWLKKYYTDKVVGYSIPAAEHSTITSWGREFEVSAYRNMLKQFAQPNKLLAVVSDSWDIYAACKLWGTELKQEVLESGATVVIRPDSGDPKTVVLKCVQILDEYFGHTINDKGYKVLNTVRVIQGDGITETTIEEILENLLSYGYSADNVSFGSGGYLLQNMTRDTLKFAMKCSSITICDDEHDVYKDPITDPGKLSKKGRLKLVSTATGYHTIRDDGDESNNMLKRVYSNGFIREKQTFDEIRARAELTN